MIKIGEDLQALLEDLVGLAALDVDDEADSAGIVFKPRIVEPLLHRTGVLLVARNCAAVSVLMVGFGRARGIHREESVEGSDRRE